MRCIVIGESNTSVEAAHELGMKCVVLSGNNPVYNFTSADLVVRDLSQLSFLNLKKLFGQEGLVEPRLSPEDVASMGGSSSSSSSSMEAQYDMGLFGDDDADDYDNEPGGGGGGAGAGAFFRERSSSRGSGGISGSGRGPFR
jgi:hypothetical protein